MLRAFNWFIKKHEEVKQTQVGAMRVVESVPFDEKEEKVSKIVAPTIRMLSDT